MKELERLSLVSKICSELENHFGVVNKDVAEFIIALATEAKTFDKFKKALSDNGLGGEFDDSLTGSLLRLINHMMPSLTKRTKKGDSVGIPDEKKGKITLLSDAKDERKALCPALADEIKREQPSADAMMAQLEGLMPKMKEADAREKRDRGDRRDRDRETRRSRSRSYDRRDDRRSGRGGDRGRDERGGRGGDRGRALLEAPELGGIYNGTVNNIRKFGAFIALEGFRSKMVGLCHISQLRNERVTDVSDVLSRSQKVKVKVTKMEGGKMSLSMKEVDQDTGKDLAPKEADLHPEAVGVFHRNRSPEREKGGTAGAGGTTITAKPRVRLSTPERWELQQMRGAGAITHKEMSDFYEEMGVHGEEYDDDVEMKGYCSRFDERTISENCVNNKCCMSSAQGGMTLLAVVEVVDTPEAFRHDQATIVVVKEEKWCSIRMLVAYTGGYTVPPVDLNNMKPEDRKKIQEVIHMFKTVDLEERAKHA